MSGPDNIRGINFQHAIAMHACLDLLLDAQVSEIRVEGSADVIDIEILDAEQRVVLAEQVKSRQGRPWSRQEILAILKKWIQSGHSAECAFQFTTDGALGPSATKILKSFQANTVDEQLMRNLGLDQASRLPEVRVRSGLGGVEEQLDLVELRLIRLSAAEGDVDIAGIQSRVDRLFRTVALKSARGELKERALTRGQIAEVVDVDLSRLDSAGDWTDVEAAEYLEEVLVMPDPIDLVPLGLQEERIVPPAFQMVSIQDNWGDSTVASDEPVTPDALLTTGGLVIGRTGSGKTTLLNQVRRLAASRSMVAILVTNDMYSSKGLMGAVSNAIEGILGRRIHPAAVRRLMATRSTVVLFDGVSELSPALRKTLAEELIESEPGSGCLLVVSGRDVDVVRSVVRTWPGLRGFRPLDLTNEDRWQILVERGRARGADTEQESGLLLAEIENALGEDAGNPLLFGMAVSLVLEGRSLGGRSDLYSEFLKGFAARAGESHPEGTFLALGCGWSKLLSEGRRAASRYEWNRLISESIDSIGELHGQGPEKAERVIKHSEDLGILRRHESYSPLGPVHDSFADYLSCLAAVNGLTRRAASSNIAQEEELTFYAEIMGIDAEFALELVSDNPLLAVRLSQFEQRADSFASVAEQVPALLELLTQGRGIGDAERSFSISCGMKEHHIVVMLMMEMTSHAHTNGPTFLMPAESGPLAIALRIWGWSIRRRLAERSKFFAHPRLADVDAAIDALEGHEQETSLEAKSLVDELFPSNVRERLMSALNLGLSAVVSDSEPSGLRDGRTEFPVRYSRGGGAIRVAGEGSSGIDAVLAAEYVNRTSVEHLLDVHPAREAGRRIRDALKLITRSKWPEELTH